MMMKRFRTDNTDGYSPSDLRALNQAYDELIAVLSNYEISPDDIGALSWQEHIAEGILARYDAGLRGRELVHGEIGCGASQTSVSRDAI